MTQTPNVSSHSCDGAQETAENIDSIAERLAIAITILLPRIIVRELAKEASCPKMELK